MSAPKAYDEQNTKILNKDRVRPGTCTVRPRLSHPRPGPLWERNGPMVTWTWTMPCPHTCLGDLHSPAQKELRGCDCLYTQSLSVY